MMFGYEYDIDSKDDKSCLRHWLFTIWKTGVGGEYLLHILLIVDIGGLRLATLSHVWVMLSSIWKIGRLSYNILCYKYTLIQQVWCAYLSL